MQPQPQDAIHEMSHNAFVNVIDAMRNFRKMIHDSRL